MYPCYILSHFANKWKWDCICLSIVDLFAEVTRFFRLGVYRVLWPNSSDSGGNMWVNSLCTVIAAWLIYTIIFLKSVGVRKLQVACLARSSREMSLTVRIVWQYILSRVRVSVRPSILLYAKNIHKLSQRPSKFLLNEKGRNAGLAGDRSTVSGKNTSV